MSSSVKETVVYFGSYYYYHYYFIYIYFLFFNTPCNISPGVKIKKKIKSKSGMARGLDRHAE